MLRMSTRPIETFAQRLKKARQQRHLTQEELGIRAGEKQPNISKMERGDILQTTAIARLSQALEVPSEWLELGLGKEPDWSDEQHSSEGLNAYTVAHDLSHPEGDDEPITIQWEFVVSAVSSLPARFRLAMPDDALAPHTRRGTVLIFSTTVAPIFGHGVLVVDGAGQRHVRRYAQGPAGRWIAEARNNAYLSLDSADGVQVLAVVVGRETGEV